MASNMRTASLEAKLRVVDSFGGRFFDPNTDLLHAWLRQPGGVHTCIEIWLCLLKEERIAPEFFDEREGISGESGREEYPLAGSPRVIFGVAAEINL